MFVAAFTGAVFDLEGASLGEHALDLAPIVGPIVGMNKRNPLLETAREFVRKDTKDRLHRTAVNGFVAGGVPLPENEARGLDGTFHAEARLSKGAKLRFQIPR